ncbi:TetR/AcrR family transcriptional regulator [Mumia sp. Pv 4-285]|uniref:TetR/AcrR family transcriptional regulator n=1 Tax=Mumia qirimensis TaxID=3234852 RepID=UPI00351D4757
MPASVHGPRDLAKRERLDRIRAAATELLLEKDFQSITTRDIARRAGVAEATLFRYIKGKQELLTMVYGDQLDAQLSAVEEEDARLVAGRGNAPPTVDSVVERIFHIYRRRCEFYQVAPHNASLYLRQGFEVDRDLSARPVSQGDRTIRLVASILAEGQQTGVIDPSVEAALVAQNLHGTYMHEIDRTPVRGLDPSTLWERLRPRLEVQLLPLGRPEPSRAPATP